MPSARHEVDIAVAPSVLMSVISDFDRYPDFLPEIESCEVVKSSDDQWDVAFSIKVVKRIRYTLRIRRVSPLKVRWELQMLLFKAAAMPPAVPMLLRSSQALRPLPQCLCTGGLMHCSLSQMREP